MLAKLNAFVFGDEAALLATKGITMPIAPSMEMSMQSRKKRPSEESDDAIKPSKRLRTSKDQVRRCSRPPCQLVVRRTGLCRKHSGDKHCSVKDCRRRAKTSGFCFRHKSVTCRADGCSTKARRNGLCRLHRGKAHECMYFGCKEGVDAINLCYSHLCQVTGCKNPRVAGGDRKKKAKKTKA